MIIREKNPVVHNDRDSPLVKITLEMQLSQLCKQPEQARHRLCSGWFGTAWLLPPLLDLGSQFQRIPTLCAALFRNGQMGDSSQSSASERLCTAMSAPAPCIQPAFWHTCAAHATLQPVAASLPTRCTAHPRARHRAAWSFLPSPA